MPSPSNIEQMTERIAELEEMVAELEQENTRLNEIINYPCTPLFVNREPTQNERHLINIISWRQREAAEARAELATLRASQRAEWEAAAKWGQEQAKETARCVCMFQFGAGGSTFFSLAQDIAAIPVVDLPDDWTPEKGGE